MGMTVGCARCHNHKFDPIPQKDYYRIQAVFFSTRGVDIPLVPAHEVDAHRAATSRIEADAETAAPGEEEHRGAVPEAARRREIAQLPEYLQIAWNTPPGERTEGQR